MKEHLRVVILGVIMLFSANAFGELVSPSDAVSIEAMIGNHKTYKSFLRYRVVSEKGLDSIHGTTVKKFLITKRQVTSWINTSVDSN